MSEEEITKSKGNIFRICKALQGNYEAIVNLKSQEHKQECIYVLENKNDDLLEDLRKILRVR